jgi:hypothetical protein
MISKAFAVKIVPLRETLFLCLATVALLLGCAPAPEAVYKRLLSVDNNLVSYTVDDALAAAKVIMLVPGREQEILISESDPVFDAGWTRSYFRVLAVEGRPGRSYLVTVRSICNCLVPLKTILPPYVVAVDDRGEVLGEGPVTLELFRREYGLEYHLEGKFDLLTGTRERVYLLVFGDNRNAGSGVGFWVISSSSYDHESDSYETTTENEIVSNPVGIVRLKVEERE